MKFLKKRWYISHISINENLIFHAVSMPVSCVKASNSGEVTKIDQSCIIYIYKQRKI